jgi:NAD(P)-dependent dehydrogenase (short-subunit alcohol dehydrogenase family)
MAWTIDLAGKVALVTGAGTGIGAGIAEALAHAGAAVVISYHSSAQGARALAERLGSAGHHVMIQQADVARLDHIDTLVQATVERFGGIDILVNNSGITDPHPPLELTEEEWDRTLDINLKGLFFCAQRAARVMIARGVAGSIINLSSVHALRVYPNCTHYAATKSGINQLTRSLALHLARHGIRVNAIAPGAVEVERYFRTMPDYDRDAWARSIPLGRVGVPSDIGPLAVFLASEYASWLTGQVIYVDGGGTL